MSDFQIHEAGDTDDTEIQRLLRHLNPEAPPGRWNWDCPRHESKAFAARENQHVIGFALASFFDHGPSNYGVIEELVVAETHRGRRVGQRLLKECTQWLESQKLQIVFVSTNAKARSLYLREGFRDCTGPWMWRTLSQQ
jgi:GNAT superfamily N-acetyltransferase